MGLFSGSSSKSYTSNETITQNAAFSEVEGPAVALQGNGNIVRVTDGGAIRSAFEFSRRLAESSADQFRETTNLLNDTNSRFFSAVGDANRASINAVTDTSNRAFSAIGDANRASINAVTDTAGKAFVESASSRRDALTFGSAALNQTLNFADVTRREAINTIGDTNRLFTNKFSEFANRQSASSDQRVVDISKWALGGVAVIFVINAWMNRSKTA